MAGLILLLEIKILRYEDSCCRNWICWFVNGHPFASRLHRGCLPNGGARGEGFALNELPHPCCVLCLNAKVWFFFEIAMALVYCITALTPIIRSSKKSSHKIKQLFHYLNVC